MQLTPCLQQGWQYWDAPFGQWLDLKLGLQDLEKKEIKLSSAISFPNLARKIIEA